VVDRLMKPRMPLPCQIAQVRPVTRCAWTNWQARFQFDMWSLSPATRSGADVQLDIGIVTALLHQRAGGERRLRSRLKRAGLSRAIRSAGKPLHINIGCETARRPYPATASTASPDGAQIIAPCAPATLSTCRSAPVRYRRLHRP
jgi:hypothetical protein